ncbi:DUF2726 domain-containing protein [Acinetobacter sp. WZC-1]|uniref:DUF2726 domain-containing protein n=1 Tax=Acinetobacter sp. WZC-1 TaxID=3459034 RepID=UPI00403D8676
MSLLLTIIGIIILGIIAIVLVKPKKLTGAEKREQAKQRMLEQDKREREKRLKLEGEAKFKAEEEERPELEVEAKSGEGQEERPELGAAILSRKEQEEQPGLEAETQSREEEEGLKLKKVDSESEQDESEVTRKPLEEVIKGKIRKSRPLSMNEQPTFKRLRETLEPEYVVLSQVSFSAILWTWSKSVRNRYNRKIVDFVICDKGFNVVAVVELDDLSHKGEEERDTERDLLFREAGITVFRYKLTPESSRILEDIKSIQL